MNLNIKRTIFAILTIATCIIIFIFSNQNGEKSGLTSRGFVRKIVEITGITNNLNEKYTCPIILNMPLSTENKTIYDGSLTLKSECDYNFIKE